jgi:N-acetylglucosamine-6-sulfatase
MRKLLALIAGLALVVLGLAACSTPNKPDTTDHLVHTTAATRPNFVFVLTDDLAWNLVSHMPAVLNLEKTGTTMSHYYVVDSLCCPSRTAIFTGEYPHDDGVFTNTGSDGGYATFNSHQDYTRSFAVALQKAGYQTAMMGKYLNGYLPPDGVQPGWDTWDVTGNGYPEFNYNLNENGTIVHFGHQPKDYLTQVLSNKAGAFINTASQSGHPFMLEVATFAPHSPYTPAPKYANAAANVAYPKTPAYNKLPVNPPTWLKGRPALGAAEKATILTDYRKRVEADMSVDDMITHLESVLKARGVARNTYFIFSSDNGYHMGEYRLDPGKQTAFDTDVHVPLIVTGPGVPAGHVTGDLASNIDLNPTILTLAGVPVLSTADGHSLVALWHGQEPANWRNAILIEHHGPDDNPADPDRQNALSGDPPSYEAVRTLNALYVRYTSSGEQEYYKTGNDPYELDNIASQGVPANLRQALNALQTCHGGKACWAAAHLP